ncbi:MAG: hypothetical protein ACE5Q6_27345 [Dehalococcoidia bacterium]
MPESLLNLISTPVPVLNTLGLNLRVGLSSEDPMVGRHPSEPYTAYLSVYSPEGVLLDRSSLGEIPPERRRFFDISGATRSLVPEQDHLVVVHRVPSRLLPQVSSVEEELELQSQPDYSLFRSLVEYSFPGGGNGSVIYETPPRFNADGAGPASSNTLTFTCQTVLSELLDTHIILIHHSVSPHYSRIAHYSFAFHTLSGERVFTDRVAIGPFAIKVLNIKQLIPQEIFERERDPEDGLSTFTFVGYSDDAALLFVAVNTVPSLGAVAVEHTHPPQTYLFPGEASQQRRVKLSAMESWKSILSTEPGGK